MSSRADAPIDLLTQTNWSDVAASGKPTTENKGMAALVTSSDGDLATNTAMTKTPVFGGYVVVLVRGIQVSVGDGVKTKCCYFSGDGGTTARAFADVATGDKLYWNGSVAGYELRAGWRIDFYYLESESGVGGGGASVGGIITTGAVELWVRPVDGDDANSGTSSLTPLATIQAAIDKLPYIIAHLIFVHIGAQTGSGHAAWLLGPRQLRANIWLVFDGGGAVGDDGFVELVGSTAAIAGSTVGQIVTGGTFTPNQYRGKTIEVLTGNAAGDRKTIQEHDADTFKVGADFSAAVAATDTFRILEPDAAFFLPPSRDGRNQEFRSIVTGCGHGGAEYYANDYHGKVFVVNAKIKPDPTIGFGGLACLDSTVSFLGCELDPLCVITMSQRSQMLYGIEDYAYEYQVPSAYNDGIGATQRSSWFGWGLHCPDGVAGYFFGGAAGAQQGGGLHAGFMVASSISTFYGGLILFGGNLFGEPGVSVESLQIGTSFTSVDCQQTNKLLVYGARADRAAVRVWSQGTFGFNNTKITGIGDGIEIFGDGFCTGFFGATRATINVSKYGVKLSRAGKMEVGVPDGDASEVQGGLADFTMNDGGGDEFDGSTVTAATRKHNTAEGTTLWGRG